MEFNINNLTWVNANDNDINWHGGSLMIGTEHSQGQQDNSRARTGENPSEWLSHLSPERDDCSMCYMLYCMLIGAYNWMNYVSMEWWWDWLTNIYGDVWNVCIQGIRNEALFEIRACIPQFPSWWQKGKMLLNVFSYDEWIINWWELHAGKLFVHVYAID